MTYAAKYSTDALTIGCRLARRGSADRVREIPTSCAERSICRTDGDDRRRFALTVTGRVAFTGRVAVAGNERVADDRALTHTDDADAAAELAGWMVESIRTYRQRSRSRTSRAHGIDRQSRVRMAGAFHAVFREIDAAASVAVSVASRRRARHRSHHAREQRAGRR